MNINRPTDEQMIEWLELQNRKCSYTGKCIFRWSITGRGWRLYETDHAPLVGGGPFSTVREALEHAMREDGSW